MKRIGNRAERAGRAAKTARRLRRDRERVVGWTAAALLGLPLLFVAVWTRMEVTRELRTQDDLVAQAESLERSVLEMSWKRERLVSWENVEQRAENLGLHPPGPRQVVWVGIDRAPSRRGG